MKNLFLFLFACTLFSCTSTFKVDVPKNIKVPCVIYFSSDHCGWCRKFDPNWEKVKNDTNFKNIVFYKDDELYNENELIALFDVGSVPAVVFIANDGVAVKTVGYESESEFYNKMKDFKKLNQNDNVIKAMKRAVADITTDDNLYKSVVCAIKDNQIQAARNLVSTSKDNNDLYNFIRNNQIQAARDYIKYLK